MALDVNAGLLTDMGQQHKQFVQEDTCMVSQFQSRPQDHSVLYTEVINFTIQCFEEGRSGGGHELDCKGKSKGKVQPITGPEGPEGE